MSKVDEHVERIKRSTGASFSGLRAIEDSFQELTRVEQQEVVQRLREEMRKIARDGNGAVLKTEGR